MNTEQLLTAVRNKYIKCKTYTDEGLVKFIDSDRCWKTTNFKTALAKPNYFRFEFYAYPPREKKSSEKSIFWVNDKKRVFNLISDYPIRDSVTKLQHLLFFADVNAAGAISQIPSIFYRKVYSPHRYLLELDDIRFVDSEVTNEFPYVIRCTRYKSNDYMIWIDCDFCIRRIVRYSVWADWSDDEVESHLSLLLSLSSSLKMVQVPSGAYFDDYRYEKVEFDGPVEVTGEPL